MSSKWQKLIIINAFSVQTLTNLVLKEVQITIIFNTLLIEWMLEEMQCNLIFVKWMLEKLICDRYLNFFEHQIY